MHLYGGYIMLLSSIHKLIHKPGDNYKGGSNRY